MTLAWRVIAAGLAIALTAYFLWFAVHALDLTALREVASSGSVLVAVVVAALMYASIIPVTGWAWSVLLSSRGERWRPMTLGTIVGLAQLAKYVPGNVAQHAARAAIAIRKGMTPASLVASVAQETVLAIAASLAIGLLALLASGHTLASLEPGHVGLIAIAGTVLLGAVLVFSLSKGRAIKVDSHPVSKAVHSLTTLPGPRATGIALAAYSLNYLLIGAGLWLVAAAIGESSNLTFFTVTAAFALSWLLGFMAPGAPAGLGAREGIMLMLLHGAAPAEVLMTFVLLARLVTMLGDVFSFLGAALLQSTAGRLRMNQ